eukprot:2131285-Rhodomonas_salina.5
MAKVGFVVSSRAALLCVLLTPCAIHTVESGTMGWSDRISVNLGRNVGMGRRVTERIRLGELRGGEGKDRRESGESSCINPFLACFLVSESRCQAVFCFRCRHLWMVWTVILSDPSLSPGLHS